MLRYFLPLTQMHTLTSLYKLDLKKEKLLIIRECRHIILIANRYFYYIWEFCGRYPTNSPRKTDASCFLLRDSQSFTFKLFYLGQCSDIDYLSVPCNGMRCVNGGKLNTFKCSCTCPANFKGDRCETGREIRL